MTDVLSWDRVSFHGGRVFYNSQAGWEFWRIENISIKELQATWNHPMWPVILLWSFCKSRIATGSAFEVRPWLFNEVESICKLLEYQRYDGLKHSYVYVLTGILVAAFAQFDDLLFTQQKYLLRSLFMMQGENGLFQEDDRD